MSLPQDITRSANLLVTLMSWAEAGAATEPSAGRKSTGWLAADLVTKEEINWLDREPYRWLRALFSRYLSSGENLVSSWFVDKGTGIWSDDAFGPLEGFLSDGPAGTASLVTDLWLDPDGTGGVRVQVNAAKAAPATFLANKDTYIFVPIDLIVPPTVSVPELALLDVAVGFPAPATPAGHVLVWRVETDGAGIVGQEILLPDFPVLKQVGFEIISAAIAMVQGDLDVGGNVEIDGTLDVTGNSMLGVDETNVQQVHGAVTIGTDTTNTTTVRGAMNVAGNSTLGVDATNVQQVHGDVIVGTDVTNTTALHGDVTVGTNSTNTTSIEGDVTIGSASSNTPSIKGNLTIGSTNLSVHEVDGVMTFNDGATVAAGKALALGAGASIAGDDSTFTDVGRSTMLDLQFDDAGTNLPAVNLRVRWNETTATVRMPDGTVRSWPVPARGKDLLFNTAGAIASTTAIATSRIQETEEVRIEFTFDYEHTGGLVGTLSTRIEVNGTPGTTDIDSLDHLLPASSGVRWRDKKLIFYWRPDDDFIAPGTEDYQFTVRIGSNLGATLNVRNIDITVESAIFV